MKAGALLTEEANIFARNLLMPERMVIKYWYMCQSVSDKPFKDMCVLFVVEPKEMAMRLAELGLLE